MAELFNKTETLLLRRTLRHNMTAAERLLWQYLRASQIDGNTFRRQYSIGPYIVDFYCLKKHLAIEVDGDSHFQVGATERDVARQQFIETFGIRFIRFTDKDIFDSMEEVIERIKNQLNLPQPLLRKEG